MVAVPFSTLAALLSAVAAGMWYTREQYSALTLSELSFC